MSRLSAPQNAPARPRRSRFSTRAGLALVAAVAVVPVTAALAPATATASTTYVKYTMTRTANADSFTTTTSPNYHFGSWHTLNAGYYGHDFERSFVHFTRGNYDRVVSATLTLTRGGRWGNGTVAVGTTYRPWTERSLNRRNQPAPAAWLGGTWIRGSHNTVSIDVKRAFVGHAAATIVLQMLGHHLQQFRSREASSGRPTLRLVLERRSTTGGGGSGGGSGGGGGTGGGGNPPAPGNCPVSSTLVPSCGRWWGLAPMSFESMSISQAVQDEDDIANRQMNILHEYHINGQLFPTPAERAAALQTGYPKLLLENWKPATDMSWAAVARGGADSRIDAEAAYLKANFPYRFFLTIYHEPEDNVNPAAGSGMTASDYAAMYRHVVLRLRADGVHNAVTVMNYMGFDKWAEQSWFSQLWPGNDVVDWIGLDPYGTGAATGYSAHDFKTLVDRPEKGFPGYYTWAQRTHPDKPIMLCEWGVQYAPSDPSGQANLFDSMKTQLDSFPNIKALVYYDVPHPPAGTNIPQTTVTLNGTAKSAYRQMAASLADQDEPSVQSTYGS